MVNNWQRKVNVCDSDLVYGQPDFCQLNSLSYFSNAFRWNCGYGDDRSARALFIGNGSSPSIGGIRGRLIIRWRVSFAEGSFLDQHGLPARRLYSSHSHAQTGLLGTGDVKSGIAIAFVTLNAGTNASFFAKVTGEPPSRCGYALDAVDWLEKNRVRKPHFRYP